MSLGLAMGWVDLSVKQRSRNTGSWPSVVKPGPGDGRWHRRWYILTAGTYPTEVSWAEARGTHVVSWVPLTSSLNERQEKCPVIISPFISHPQCQSGSPKERKGLDSATTLKSHLSGLHMDPYKGWGGHSQVLSKRCLGAKREGGTGVWGGQIREPVKDSATLHLAEVDCNVFILNFTNS